MSMIFEQIDICFLNILSLEKHGDKRLINLSDSFGKAILWFFSSASTLPDNRQRPNQDTFDTYYNRADWEGTIDVLRNETPGYFNYLDLKRRGFTPRRPIKRAYEQNAKTEQGDGLSVFYLPSYASELNPDEYLTCDLKAGVHLGKPARNKAKLQKKVIPHTRMCEKEHIFPQNIFCTNKFNIPINRGSLLQDK